MMAQAKDLVVAVVVRTEAQIKAETLRELADLWYSDAGPWADPLSTATWLRARADKIEGKVDRV
jgi:hypothetical protein